MQYSGVVNNGMGTNYYVESHAFKSRRRKHLGKSSSGWTFALHVYPELGINSFEDWFSILRDATKIVNEYGDSLTLDQMLKIITEREAPDPNRFSKPLGLLHYSSWDDFLEANHAERGPNGLARVRLGEPYCLSHGTGTWDCLTGDFS